MSRGKRTAVVFPVSTPAGNGFAYIDERDAHRVLDEPNPDYGRKLGASHSRPRQFPISWEEAKRYVGSPYRTREEVHRTIDRDKYPNIKDVGS